MSQKPIGIIDSGLGGLTIWSSIRTLLPNQSFVYLADHSRAPYGDKSEKIIQKRVSDLLGYLTDKCKMVVIACNTATVSGIDQYRLLFPRMPIIGVVPVIKTAAQMTKSGKIAVLSTQSTARSDYQKRLIAAFSGRSTIVSMSCPELVSLVEAGQISGQQVTRALEKVLSKLDPRVDVIVLGCTHFPFLGQAIRAIVGNDAAVLDSGGAVARHVKRVLDARGENQKTASHVSEFYTTGDPNEVSRIATKLMGMEMKFSYANV